MDIDRVRYFHAFAEAGSLVAAAKVLHLSQPALSKALRVLQDEVGAVLIEADGRGLRLTLAGRAFRAETTDLLARWLAVPEKTRSGHAASQVTTKIGSFEVFTTYFLEHLIKTVELESLELHEYAPSRLEEAVAEGRIDLGITYAPIPKAGIEFIEAGQIKMGIFGVKKWKSVGLEDFPFAVPLPPRDGAPSKVLGLDGWPDHRFRRRIRFRVTLMESAMQLCRQGLCVAYLPEFVVRLHNRQVRPEHRLVEQASPVGARDRLAKVYLVQRQQMTEGRLQRQIAMCLRNLN